MILSEATHELLVGQRRQNLLKINFENLSTLYLNDFLINFLMILSEATHCLNSESYAFGCWELCFRTARAMLSELGSYAFRLLEHCFQTARALLSDLGSNALDLTEQCSGPYGACLYIPIEQCSSTYGAMLWRVRSSAITSDK